MFFLFQALHYIACNCKHTLISVYFFRGVLPSDQRRKLLEKAKARAKKDRISGLSEIVVGAQVDV